ncbi:hypothetical protein D3C87_2006670 [compost metagenome]
MLGSRMVVIVVFEPLSSSVIEPASAWIVVENGTRITGSPTVTEKVTGALESSPSLAATEMA